MPSPLRVYLLAGFAAAIVSIAVTFVMVRILRDPPAAVQVQTAYTAVPPKTVIEEGEIEVTVGSDAKGTAQQFYRIPFASPPQLTFSEEQSPGYWNTQILEQTAEGFKASRDVSRSTAYSSSIKFKWRAEGLPKRFP